MSTDTQQQAPADKGAQGFEEVVTHTPVRDITLPGGAGTLALVTLDNGFDHTKPNTFGPKTIEGLVATVAELRRRADAGEIQAVGITGKPFIFAVGADLKAVGQARSREDALGVARAGHAAFAGIMDLPVPTFAFVNGAAMGGGVEIALSADYRTISSGVPAIALPETFLGLVPGWGGCWLLPNLVGPANALKVIIDNPMNMNRMLKGPQAFELGMADAMFEPADFLEESLLWAAEVVSGETTVQRPEVSRDEAEWAAALKAAKSVVDLKTGGKSPAPYRALKLVEAARTATRDEGFAAEDEALADLVMGDELRAGLYSFDLVQRRAKRPAGAPDKSLARKVTKVGIVGAGLMASQLALLFAKNLEVPVVMTDLDEERVAKGVGYVHGEVDKLLAKGRLGKDKANRLKGLVTGSTSKDGFADADFVLEAVFEEMSVKKQVWAEVEAIVGEECVLATNTSSLSITEMASELTHPERVVGFHFFNPVAVMPLLEIIKGEQTDDATLATAFATGKGLKKTTILVKDSPSFIVNRLLGRFMGEVAKVVDEGTPIEVADRAFAGLAPMPPFILLGLVGPAIALHNNETLAKAFPDRFYVSENLRKVVAAKKPAIYTWPEGKPVVDPEVEALFDKPADPVVLTTEEVRERVLGVLADEARRMLDEGVAQAPMDLDLAMITGAGFQFWNGGLTPLLDREGVSEKVTGTRFLPPGVASVPA
ncbi:3-hydroxyacyl-CoA dehydrogenase NAD-binding domain-containing protein [Phycicoccus sp. M110.8]|uniref:3-hydroxyacyl-CoA dehydrogenase NAD-binding domain-containing protein n=1 Tax=Phycicoccus sp. M110.8 TaxID=3075433 RepID=UPI0028FD08D8|nr:3-hydroxyacyl-CoA dehydrogenase NAD-binding domain-containing protein [Phycicoccus sp. M110.8]MDU0315245.1 3-hydroxyacyl-CoA dehydrogenase NAD-binding domain-containing protein [Phycicoccus sp. M110.8]